MSTQIIFRTDGSIYMMIAAYLMVNFTDVLENN